MSELQAYYKMILSFDERNICYLDREKINDKEAD